MFDKDDKGYEPSAKEIREIPNGSDPHAHGGMYGEGFDKATDALNVMLSMIMCKYKGTRDQAITLVVFTLASLCSETRQLNVVKALAHIYNNPDKKMNALITEVSAILDCKDLHKDDTRSLQMPFGPNDNRDNFKIEVFETNTEVH